MQRRIDMKKKDVLYVVLGVAVFVGVIGLLMAYSDGYLEGTLVAKIIGVVFPAALAAYGVAIMASYWGNKFNIGSGMSFLKWLIAFLLICIFIILPFSDKVYWAAIIIEAGLLAITLLVLWITGK